MSTYRREEVTTVVLMLTVPAEWVDLPTEEIERKLRGNEPTLTQFIAAEVKRTGTLNLTELRKFLEEFLKDRGA